MLENEQTVSEDRALTNIFNEYFSTITESLNIADSNDNALPVVGIPDPINATIENYRYHPSALLIKSHCRNAEALCFKRATLSEIFKQVDSLITRKASPIDSIPAKVITGNADVVTSSLLDLFNTCVDGNFFPNEMKDGDVSVTLYDKSKIVDMPTKLEVAYTKI